MVPSEGVTESERGNESAAFAARAAWEEPKMFDQGRELNGKTRFTKAEQPAAMRNKKRVRYGIRRENRPAGFRYVPCQRTARCKCGPVARPVPPLSPISWAF